MADDIQESSLTEEDLDNLIADITGKGSEEAPKEPQNFDDLLKAKSSELDSLLGTSSTTITDDELSGFSEQIPTQSPMSDIMATSANVQRTGIPWKELYDVSVKLAVELGRTMLFIKDILLLTEGSIVELDKNVGDEVDILVNDKLFARGKLIILDEFYGVQITQILNPHLLRNL